MIFETWALFTFAILVASVSPGPNVLIVIINTLKHGARGAVLTMLGNLCTLFAIALLAALGVGALLKTAPLAYSIMKVAGGAYLIWMGIKIIHSSFANMGKLDLNTSNVSQGTRSRWSIFTEAVLVSASNPKAILFLSAIFPQFLDVTQPIAPQFMLMFATIIAAVGLIHGS